MNKPQPLIYINAEISVHRADVTPVHAHHACPPTELYTLPPQHSWISRHSATVICARTSSFEFTASFFYFKSRLFNCELSWRYLRAEHTSTAGYVDVRPREVIKVRQYPQSITMDFLYIFYESFCKEGHKRDQVDVQESYFHVCK